VTSATIHSEAMSVSQDDWDDIDRDSTGSRRIVSHVIGASQRIPIACETLLHVNCCRILSATCHLLRDIAHRTIHSRKCFLWKPFGSTGTRHDWIYTPVLPRVLTPTRSVPLSRARTARLRDIQVSPIAGREGSIGIRY
jgi:hypothetical protein